MERQWSHQGPKRKVYIQRSFLKQQNTTSLVPGFWKKPTLKQNQQFVGRLFRESVETADQQ